MTTATATTNKPRGVLYSHDPSLTLEWFDENYQTPTVEELIEIKDAKNVMSATARQSLGNRWRPVHHSTWIRAMRQTLANRGYEVTSERFSVSPDGHDLAAIWNLADDGSLGGDVVPVIGLLTSNVQRTKAKILVAGEVSVCTNGIAMAEHVIGHKQTTGLNPLGLVMRGVSVWMQTQEVMRKQIETLKATELSDTAVTRSLAVAVGLEGGSKLMSSAMAIRCREEYLKPRHEEFQPRTAWSLYNAVTETFKHEKRMSNAKALELQLGMHSILTPGGCQLN